MFSFFKKLASKEHIKLAYQNEMALAYLESFLDRELFLSLSQQNSAAKIGWTPGQIFSDDSARLMLMINKATRKYYDLTPSRHIKEFDMEFRPLNGWEKYYARLLET